MQKKKKSGNQHGWIKCSDELPKEDGHYLVCLVNYNGFKTVESHRYHKKEWNIEAYYKEQNSKPYTVTHWQPLPKPPITKKRGGCNP